MSVNSGLKATKIIGVKGKDSIGKKFESLAVRGQKLLT